MADRTLVKNMPIYIYIYIIVHLHRDLLFDPQILIPVNQRQMLSFSKEYPYIFSATHINFQAKKNYAIICAHLF